MRVRARVKARMRLLARVKVRVRVRIQECEDMVSNELLVSKCTNINNLVMS